jgi:hypothetical protein
MDNISWENCRNASSHFGGWVGVMFGSLNLVPSSYRGKVLNGFMGSYFEIYI